ncbi:hypothetical protein [uncultured Endozoicomonas sp.]|uniref:hypothetical protein n=1 Tax=uncultured Endozoicomonas sp. TaxID=432652 RepID=UPI00261CC25E|nr:hypothetical protein [uncultured Endozoicomonas sp.]
MAVTYFSSEDSGAPQLVTTRNVAGNYENSIIEIMDAILINGYGTKSGLGWTKLMTSDVTDSNRTVYQNNSAHADNMNLIVQSNPANYTGIEFQIAEVVTTPESYLGYSHIVSVYQTHAGTPQWRAVGDERTFIFMYWSSYIDNSAYYSWRNYSPTCIYIGDFDDVSNSNPKAWGLLARSMRPGTLDTFARQSENKGVFNFEYAVNPAGATGRPVTRVPGQDWDENIINTFVSSFEPRPVHVSMTGIPIQDINDFSAKATVKSSWYIFFEFFHAYRLRGIYSIYPWLSANGIDNKRLWGEEVSAFGDDYMGFPYLYSNSNKLAMSVYIKLTGDW